MRSRWPIVARSWKGKGRSSRDAYRGERDRHTEFTVIFLPLSGREHTHECIRMCVRARLSELRTHIVTGACRKLARARATRVADNALDPRMHVQRGTC